MTAAQRILRKSLVASGMDSRQWSAVDAGLRDRSFFSATVEDARVLGAFREPVARVAAGEMDASSARIAMRDALTAAGYRPPDAGDQGPGGVRNLMSQRRLDLIIKTNVEQARGWARHVEGTTPGALLAFPAQRLVRVRQRRMPRDWSARWKEAGDAVGWEGASRDVPVALKLSPIWARLSRFGTPYPPFDFNSGMGVEDVGRRKARELGLLEDGETGPSTESPDRPPPAPPSFNANLQATVPTMRGDSPEAEWLRAKFGDQIDIRNGAVKWKGELIQGVLGGTEKRAEFGVASRAFLDTAASGGVDPETVKAFEGRKISLSHQFFREHGGKHLDPDEPYDHLVPAEFELLPWLWRSPSRVRPTRDPNRVQAELDTLDGGWLLAIIDCRSGLKSVQKRKAPGGIT